MDAATNTVLILIKNILSLIKLRLGLKQSTLSMEGIASVCEMWVKGVSINDIAKMHDISHNTVSDYIKKHYLGTTLNKTYTITLQSKMNSDDYEQEL